MLTRVLLFIAVMLCLVGCQARADDAAPPPLPNVRTSVLKAAGGAPIELRGTVRSETRLRLGFKQPGVVAAVLVKGGDKVRKGQVLARLDQTDALGQLRIAGANRNKARRDWQRAERLVKDNAAPTGLRDDARSAMEAAEANLVVALDAFKRTKLLSPVDGKVVERLAEPAESVGAGTPVLMVDQTANLVVKVGVTDRDLRRIEVGQATTMQLEDGSAAFKGIVTSIAPTPAQEDGLYPVEVRPEKQALQPGVLVAVRFVETKPNASLRIPLDAMVHRNDKDWVFVLDGEHGKPVVRQRGIEAGRTEGREMTVRSGLKEGERIVTEGAYFLQDGQSILVMNREDSHAIAAPAP